MRVDFDPKIDAAYISLVEIEPGGVTKTYACPEGMAALINLHFDASKRLIGVEVWGSASKRLPESTLRDAWIFGEAGFEVSGRERPPRVDVNDEGVAYLHIGDAGTAVDSTYAGRWLPKGVTLCFSEGQRLIGLRVRDWRRKLPEIVLRDAGVI
jgi:uncharacterized protein YuzE